MPPRHPRFLWAVNDSPRLSRRAREVIEDGENELFLSVASLWGIAIKSSTGKLTLDLSFMDLATRKTTEHGVEIMPITPSHLDTVSTLPFHHRDPFDRLIVAVCLAENVSLLSRDGTLDAYGIERLW